MNRGYFSEEYINLSSIELIDSVCSSWLNPEVLVLPVTSPEEEKNSSTRPGKFCEGQHREERENTSLQKLSFTSVT